jgi:two-component system, NtrC family, sensor histidine kinase HydH
MTYARWISISAFAALAGLLAVVLWALPPEHADWRAFVQRLFYLPVAGAALTGGWKAGLALAAASAAVLPLVDLPVLLIAGVGLGVFAGYHRRQRDAFARVLDQLSAAHRELRDNFDGMQRAERLSALGQLSAGLAHEIRNPLAAIAGAAGILQRHTASSERRAECVHIIAKEADRLDGLLTRFLDFARPRPPRSAPVDPGGLIEAVRSLASHAIHRKTIAFHVHVEPGLPTLQSDREQLEQVLLNLTINAIHASPEDGAVVLSARAEGDELCLGVRDEGCGVPAEHVDRLFDPFFTTKENGTGLGLPVAHQIVSQLGGALTVKRNDGPGMTFAIRLPLQPKGDHALPPHSARG